MSEEWKIGEWVEKAKGDAEKEFRQTVHTIIVAIGYSELLSRKMVVKGGILLALRYKGTRYTKDVDFSTPDKNGEIDIEKLNLELRQMLAQAVESLDYGLDCRVQSAHKKPNREDATFPTHEINIGHAYKGSSKHKMLIHNKCPDAVRIDFSLNELIRNEDVVTLSEGGVISCYSLQDLVAEKYRAIIQQKQRNRTRRQDAYDIFMLIEGGFLKGSKLKDQILETLIMKAASRNVDISPDSLADEEIMRRSKAEYEYLKDEIQGELPPFETVYDAVAKYYVSLPWKKHDYI